MSHYPFTILLSASIPSEKRSEIYLENYTKIQNAQIQIEEAIIGLSRNVFQAGGKIIFGGHPSISPLVAMVATEFKINREIENIKRNEVQEKPITIFQSRAYENVVPKETDDLFSLGYSNIIWTDSVDGEQFNPTIRGAVQCEKSLELMRIRMMHEKIDALVCMGGMEGVEKEFNMFREFHPNKPIYILRTTGGASKLIADKYSDLENVRVIDNIAPNMLNISKNENHLADEKFEIIPYLYITALIIKDLLQRLNI